MITRRDFVRGGLSAAAIGMLARRGSAYAPPSCPVSGALPLRGTAPLIALDRTLPSRIVDGLPFADWFTGDNFTDQTTYPFHVSPPCCEGAAPPPPAEHVKVAVVGGGLSGLAAAYLLRRHRPVIFDLHERFGGNAVGEVWRETPYSLGSAYVIVPDEGTFLDEFYRSLGLHRVFRYAGPQDPVELYGRIETDFWSGAGRPPQEAAAFQRYAEVVAYMAEERYPDIPLPEGKDNQWIIDLDRKTFREDLEERMGVPLPPLLAAAVQGYFYSSFNSGMQDISAAAGWNFVAAEEFGRWVFPGGNAYLAQALWSELARLDDGVPAHCRPHHLRGKCLVVDVRTHPRGAQVTYADAAGAVRSLTARCVVMACPKHVVKFMMPELESLDPGKLQSIFSVETLAYVVANVLLDAPIERDFYDLFLLHDEQFPMDEPSFEQRSQVVDVLHGAYARRPRVPRSVLTLYWPLPFHRSRISLLLGDDPWLDYAQRLAPQVRRMLQWFDVPESKVRQIRMTRWGHAFPIARPGFIADGHAEAVRRPIQDRIFFANQDNWALPAVENSLLDAHWVAQAVDHVL